MPPQTVLASEAHWLFPQLLAFSLLGWLATAGWLFWVLARQRQERKERQELTAALAVCAQQSQELKSLREGLNSHFLFNALNTIRYFVRTDTQMARDLLLDLSEFLKGAVDSSDCGTLGEELDRATSYLSLERARLGERLELRLDVGQAPAGRAFPTRVLQPLIGLLLKRGPRSEDIPWWIGVRCTTQGHGVTLTLSDNSPHPTLPEGSLLSLQARLQRWCPAATLVLETSHDVTLTLP